MAVTRRTADLEDATLMPSRVLPEVLQRCPHGRASLPFVGRAGPGAEQKPHDLTVAALPSEPAALRAIDGPAQRGAGELVLHVMDRRVLFQQELHFTITMGGEPKGPWGSFSPARSSG